MKAAAPLDPKPARSPKLASITPISGGSVKASDDSDGTVSRIADISNAASSNRVEFGEPPAGRIARKGVSYKESNIKKVDIEAKEVTTMESRVNKGSVVDKIEKESKDTAPTRVVTDPKEKIDTKTYTKSTNVQKKITEEPKETLPSLPDNKDNFLELLLKNTKSKLIQVMIKHIHINQGDRPGDVNIEPILPHVNPTAVLKKDDFTGMTAIHALLVMSSATSSAAATRNNSISGTNEGLSKPINTLLRSLLNSYHHYTYDQLHKDFELLEEEHCKSIQYLRKTYSSTAAVDTKTKAFPTSSSLQEEKYRYDPFVHVLTGKESPALAKKILAINDWFTHEKDRRIRQAEFRIELYYHQLLTTKDNSGRTLLHTAVVMGTPASTVEVLLTCGRGKFDVAHDNIPAKNLHIFQKGVMYELTTGREVASRDNAVIDMSADGKTDSFGVSLGLRSVLYDIPLEELSNRYLTGEADAIAGSTDSLHNSFNEPVVNYEVVLPWVMRNIIKRCAELGAKRNKSGIEMLQEIVRSNIDFMPQDEVKNVLILEEVQQILGLLSIRVTTDIVRELCVLYPADAAESREKFNYLLDKQELEEQVRREAKHALSESKSERKESAKQHDDDRRADSKADAKSSTKTTHFNLVQNADNYGLDLIKLFEAMKSGRAFKSINSNHEEDHLDPRYADAIENINKNDTRAAESKDATDSKASAGDASPVKLTRKFPKSTARNVPTHVTIASLHRTRVKIVNSQDSDGCTPLILAASLDNKDMVVLLLAHGADISITSLTGDSALTTAKSTTIKSLLEKQLILWMNKKQLNDDDYRKSISRGEITATDSIIDGSDRGIHNSFDVTEGRSKFIVDLRAQLQSLSDHNWSYSRSPLSWAVINGLYPAVRELLRTPGNDVNKIDTVGRTPLHECLTLAGPGTTEPFAKAALGIAEELLSNGADINAISVSGRTPLHEVFCKSADNSNSSYSRLPSGNGEGYYSPVTAIDAAQLTSYKRLVVRAMLQWKADPLILDRHGLSPIHYCARENMAGCMVEILRAGYNGGHGSSSEQTPLHVACKAGAAKVIHLLCRWDADHRLHKCLIARKDKQGKLCTQMLATSTSPKCLETLWGVARSGSVAKTQEVLTRIKGSKDCLYEGVDSTNTAIATHPTHSSDSAEEKDGMEDLTKSLEGAEKAIRRAKGDESKEDAEELVNNHEQRELWLLNGIDSKSRRMQWSALHACITGWAEFEAQFSLTGSKASAKSNSKLNLQARTALELPPLPPYPSTSVASAATPICNHRDTILLLLKNQAYVDSLDINCRTPLMYAACANLVDACRILVEAGAHVNSADLDGNTALHFAYMLGSSNAVSYLESINADSNVTNNSGRAPFEEAGRYSKVKNMFYSSKM